MSHAINNVGLGSQQRCEHLYKIASPYTKNDLVTQAQVVGAYMKSRKDKKYFLIGTVGLCIVSTHIGSNMGRRIGAVFGKDSIAENVTKYIGAGLGFLAGTYACVRGIKRVTSLDSWKMDKLKDVLQEFADNHYSNEPALEPHMCSINAHTILVAAKIPDCNESFDLDWLLNDARRNGESIEGPRLPEEQRRAEKIRHPHRNDPTMNDSFTELEISIDHEKTIEGLGILSGLILRDKQSLPEGSYMIEVIDTVLTAIAARRDAHYEAAAANLQIKLEEHQITVSEQCSQTARLIAIYNRSLQAT